LLCWQLGCRLLRDNLEGGRAAYGKRILATVSQEIDGRTRHRVQLHLADADGALHRVDDQMCRIERWDVRTLRRKTGGMLYQRTALSKQPDVGATFMPSRIDIFPSLAARGTGP
jgi:hypothetical protein